MKAQYGILRFAKYKGPEVGHIEAHNERTKENYASNPDVDTSRSRLNFHLVTPQRKYRAGVLYLLRPLTAERDFPCSGRRFRWQQNSVFAMPSKLQKWSVRSQAIRRDFNLRGNEAGSPREQKGYKARRSDASPRSQYHHGSSSHTLSRASASVDFALLSER